MSILGADTALVFTADGWQLQAPPSSNSTSAESRRSDAVTAASKTRKAPSP